MQQRRFEELPVSDPEAVTALGDDHPAIINSTTMFETTIVHPGRTRDNILVSGHNSRKIGKVVTKGPWRGKPIYTLTLVERMTCPTSCHMLRTCYGNAMPFARRNAPGDDFERRLEDEIETRARHHPKGFVVRLHVLGDFYSVRYVRLWGAMMERHPEIHVFGYTAAGTSGAPEWNAIADEIDDLNEQYPDRWVIRHSSDDPTVGGAHVIDRVPEAAVVPEGIVCPAEREKTGCCATCGLCWSPEARDKTIVFVRHGMGSRKSDRIAQIATATTDGIRPVRAMPNLTTLAKPPRAEPPTMLWVTPSDLYVDEKYQRALSRLSTRLISKIVQEWDWTRFKPPIVVRNAEGRLEVLDGQHTAIAAATHPEIEQIPIMLVTADSVASRARAFIGHNRDRIAVTPLQLHHSAVVAEDSEAAEIDRICSAASVRLLRMPPANPSLYRPGDTIALGAIRTLLRTRGSSVAQRVLTLMSAAGRAPLRADEIKGLGVALSGEVSPGDAEVTAVLRSSSYESILADTQRIISATGLRLTDAMAATLTQRLAATRENTPETTNLEAAE